MIERGLGRGPGAGLSALFKDDNEGESTINIPISKIEPRQDQPRSVFDQVNLEELADSIKKYGMIQPITVRKLYTGYYQIIAGERRWRAARLAGLREISARVIEADEKLATEIALVENLQREDLNPIEEALGYKTLMQEYGMTQDEAAQSVGKSRPTITNALRLLSLNGAVLKMIEEGVLSAGHARALLQIKGSAEQASTAEKVVREGLSVRQTEALAARIAKLESAPPSTEPDNKSISVNYVEEVEKNLSSVLGRKVNIEYKRKKGRIMLEYYGSEDLERLIEMLLTIEKNEAP